MKLSLPVFIFGAAAAFNHGDLCSMDGKPCPIDVADEGNMYCPRLRPNADFVYLLDASQDNDNVRNKIQKLTEKLGSRMEEAFGNVVYTSMFAWQEAGNPLVSVVESYAVNDFVQASQGDFEGYPETITSIFDLILEATKQMKFHTENSRMVLVNTSSAPGTENSESYKALLEFFRNYDLAVVFSVPQNDDYPLWEELAMSFQNDGAYVGVEEILLDSELTDYNRWFTEHELFLQLCQGVPTRTPVIQVPQWPIYPAYYKAKNFKGPFKTRTPLLDYGTAKPELLPEAEAVPE